MGAIVVLFAASVMWQSVALPPMEGSDEPLHVTYVAVLRETGRLPARADYMTNCTRQQSGQPPLWYAVGALALEMARVPRFDCDALYTYAYDTVANPWRLSPNPQRTDDNKTNFFPLAAPLPPEGVPRGLVVLRGLSLMAGVVAVLGAYAVGRELFGPTAWALTVAAVFAFTPTFSHLSAYYTNDTPAAAFSVWALWLSVRTIQRGATWQHSALLALLIGLGGLVKVSVLLVAPMAVFAVTWAVWHERTTGRYARLIRHGAAMALPVALTVGVWMAWGWFAYHDPFGTGTHVHPTLNYDPPLGWGAVWRGLPHMAATYVGLLGYANVFLPAWAYALMGAAALIAFGGLLSRRPPNATTWALVAALVLLMLTVFLGFTRWYRTIFGVTGRLLMPSHAVYAVALTAGFAALSARVPRGRRVLIAALVGVHLVASGAAFGALHTAYAPPLRDPANLPALNGPRITFDDTVRLLGYTSSNETLTTPIHTLTLCWEVLQPTDRHAAYAVRYVKDGIPTAARTTVFGLGRYNSTQWTAGAVFCDVLDMPVGDPQFGGAEPVAGTTYDILVVMLDAATQDVNWSATTDDGTPVAFPVIGQLRYP